MGVINLESSLIFSSKSFLPRSAAANLTVYFNGRAHNLLEVSLMYTVFGIVLDKIIGKNNYKMMASQPRWTFTLKMLSLF